MGQRAVDLCKAFLGDDSDEFGATPRAHEGDRADTLHGQISEQVGGFGRGGAAYRCTLLTVEVGERWLPEGEDQLAPWGGVVVDLMDREPGEAFRGHPGVGSGRRGQEEDRVGAVAGAQTAQSAHHLGDMRAEDAPVGVALVDHDEAQGAQEGGPAGM